MISSTTFLLALALGARILYVERNLSTFRLLRCERSGCSSVELRRCAGLVRPQGSSQAFPQPQESRMLVKRIAGIPVWRRVRTVGLPLQVDVRIDQLDAQEFDHLFEDRFRLRAQA